MDVRFDVTCHNGSLPVALDAFKPSRVNVRHPILSDCGVSDLKISVSRAGVSFPGLPELAQPRTNSGFTLLFTGTNFYREGGVLLLQAFVRFRKAHPEACLIFVTKDVIPVDMLLADVNVLG